jgi:hypothetical protein
MGAVPDPEDAANGGGPRYAYKPSLVGAPCEFVLMPEALHFRIGRRSGLVRYDRVRSVRMSFRPVTLQSHRFITEIRSPDNPRIQISSASWRSMMEQERLDAAYSAFIADLHRRLAAASSTAHFSAGTPVTIYWIGFAVFAGVMLATAVMVVRALQNGQWTAAALVGAFFLTFAFQLGNYFRRNRPCRYRPEALPEAVLPRVSKR